LSRWRIGRILMRKKTGLLKQGWLLCFWWVERHQCPLSCWNFWTHSWSRAHIFILGIKIRCMSLVNN
jgi:hypothetical protein